MLGVNEFPYEYAYEERQPGLWVADVDIPALHLQLQDIFLPARSDVELEYKLHKYIHLFVNRLRCPPRAMWN